MKKPSTPPARPSRAPSTSWRAPGPASSSACSRTAPCASASSRSARTAWEPRPCRPASRSSRRGECVARHVEAGPPVRVQYTLTAQGPSLRASGGRDRALGAGAGRRRARQACPVPVLTFSAFVRRGLFLAVLAVAVLGVWTAVVRPRWAQRGPPPARARATCSWSRSTRCARITSAATATRRRRRRGSTRSPARACASSTRPRSCR